MNQLQGSLFDEQPSFSLDDLFAELDKGDGSRWYQRECIDAIKAQHAEVRSTLIVMATGLGKTFCFSRYAHEWDQGPVLVLAHRDELIQQAQASLSRMVGDFVDVEQADNQASFRARYVVGSVQSMMQKKRLERMGHDRFSLVIVDEAHHATAASYRKVMDWFGPAKILGVTATPDRGDEKALGQCFDSVSYVYDIEQGIDDGYLVPLLGKHVDVKEVDVSKVKTSKGDLAEGELDELMMQACAGIVSGVLEHAPERKAIAFMPGIRSAALLMETFNEKQPGSTCYIDGKTPKDERREIIRDFNAGRYLRLANCGIATEGFDSPGVNLVIHGRPTKSRALYAQMTGRGTRVLPGLVDGIRHREGADQRRALVAGSAKPNCLLLDFVANSGKHDLVTPEDLLGGNYDEEEVKLAKKKAKEGGGGDVREELEKARQELKRLAAAAQAAKVKAEVRDFDPFRAFGVDISEARRYDRYGKPMPGWVRESLERKGVSAEELGRLSGRAAFKLHDELKRRHKADLCTLKQSRILTKYGVDPAKLSFARATEAIDYLASVRWRPDATRLHDIIERPRQPGEE